ncbi:MAG: hypothetical protein JOY54_02260 [Acidobacteriaceae bacterium]|nr:hypothetical protein [Acidobacteriaceae bacterium]
MPNDILTCLSDEDVVEANALATVTRRCIVLRNPARHSQTVIFLCRLSAVKSVRSSYPGFLVIAVGLFLIAAAAIASKNGHEAFLPVALLALGFVIAFLGTRRGSVCFVVGSERMETISGSLKDAATIAAAVDSVWRREEAEAA